MALELHRDFFINLHLGTGKQNGHCWITHRNCSCVPQVINYQDEAHRDSRELCPCFQNSTFQPCNSFHSAFIRLILNIYHLYIFLTSVKMCLTEPHPHIYMVFSRATNIYIQSVWRSYIHTYTWCLAELQTTHIHTICLTELHPHIYISLLHKTKISDGN